MELIVLTLKNLDNNTEIDEVLNEAKQKLGIIELQKLKNEHNVSEEKLETKKDKRHDEQIKA